MLHSNFVFTVIVFLTGVLFGAVVYPRAAITPADLRRELRAQCIAHPELVAEIDAKLPDNNQGRITAQTMREVLRAVVERC